MEKIDFKIGDILIDTQYDDYFGISCGHSMLVVYVDNNNDRILISHSGFDFPETIRWIGYNSFIDKNLSINQPKKYLIRWIGPEKAIDIETRKYTCIREKIFETVNDIYKLSKTNTEINYSWSKGIYIALTRNGFMENRKIKKELKNILEEYSFICSSYITFIWKYVLETFLLAENITIDDDAFPINPFEFLPKDIFLLPNKYPQYWALIPYIVEKINNIEMQEIKSI